MIKLTFFILPILTLTMSCDRGYSLRQTFNTTTVNIELAIKKLIKPESKVSLTHAVKYKNEFYCFFEEVKYDNSAELKFCFVFSITGKNIRKIEVPDDVQNNVYYDLFVRNNKVYIKTYIDSETFYFNDKNSKWVKTKNTQDLIFEDEKFYVYSLDFGEWGGKTWFKDKKTGIEYAIEATTPLVNKINSNYYLTNSSYVLKIKNPLKLNKCSNDVTYENIEKNAKYTSWYGKPIGVEIVYKDTTTRDYFDVSYSPYIVSSFVYHNELLHIYETETGTYIVKAEKNSIKTIQKIGDKLRFYNWYNSYRSKIQKNKQQLLKFKKDNKFGLLEINGQDINIYNLKLK
jgi:hypothetical protein